MFPNNPVTANTTSKIQPDNVIQKVYFNDFFKAIFLKAAQNTTSRTASSRPENI